MIFSALPPAEQNQTPNLKWELSSQLLGVKQTIS